MVAVSVVTPVFNGGQYLAAAVESILAQTHGDFEYIVLDDGSTDGSFRILQEYERRDPRMRVVSRENRGVVSTLNELFEYAQGDYVAIMAQDDIALPERLALQAEFLQKNPGVVCVGGATEMIDAKGRYLTLIWHPATDEEIQRLALRGLGGINASAAMVRRESHFRVGGYDPDLYLAEDLDMWLRLGEVGQLANLRDTVLKYRLHSGSISEQYSLRQIDVARMACERAWRRRGISESFEVSSPWRPGKDRDSQHEFLLRCGWWAFNSGERKTAMLYGVKALAKRPLDSMGWRLLICAAVKPKSSRR